MRQRHYVGGLYKMLKKSLILIGFLIACTWNAGGLFGQITGEQFQDLIDNYKVSTSSARVNYRSSLDTVQSKQREYGSAYLQSDPAGREELRSEARSCLTERLLMDIAPAWDRTPWTFNGYSSTPGQGSIACGWYVQRLMEDLGFTFSKRRSQQPYFAQNWPKTMVEGLDREGAEIIYRIGEAQETDSLFMARDAGIYIIGFAYSGMDSGAHVGFLLNTREELYVLHSMGRVELVPAIEEPWYYSSQFYYLGEVFNHRVMDCWLRDEPLDW